MWKYADPVSIRLGNPFRMIDQTVVCLANSGQCGLIKERGLSWRGSGVNFERSLADRSEQERVDRFDLVIFHCSVYADPHVGWDHCLSRATGIIDIGARRGAGVRIAEIFDQPPRPVSVGIRSSPPVRSASPVAEPPPVRLIAFFIALRGYVVLLFRWATTLNEPKY
jgi:hypothetical protein